MIFVDTWVLVDVFASDARWRDWSVARLAHWSSRGRLLINPVMFAEWCPDFATFEQAEAAVREFGLLWRKFRRAPCFWHRVPICGTGGALEHVQWCYSTF